MIETLALIAGIAMSLAIYPQVFKIYKARDAAEISIISYTIFTLGGLVWIFYGISIVSKPIILTYTVGTIGNLLIFIEILKFKKVA